MGGDPSWSIPNAGRRTRGPPVAARRGRACSGLGTASCVYLLRHSFQAVSQTGTLHPKPKLRQSYSNFGLAIVVGLRTSLSGMRVRNAASWPASDSAPAGQVRGPQLSVHRVDRVLDRAGLAIALVTDETGLG